MKPHSSVLGIDIAKRVLHVVGMNERSQIVLRKRLTPTLRLLGDIAAHRDPPEVEEAEASYRQALALAEELGMRPLQAHCHRGLGTLYAATGQREQARTDLSAAIDLYQAMEMTFWLPEAEAVLA